ncbi:hypothetical protein DFP72DRAFT_1054624 [Ephemerocybe angulata]|uniref:Uncharacterized protein n=1 Tax=Ephemerocybe angulata TaxID=980116 RepID=A0A8H6H997_9AGAR|nr:hypothetical protein DFP72DRAFT_1054620 [Tulosesus angulatus]KAF6741900.1 hypothetical protein DFP72DRAFT_1054624 [Tulosesus angulatus]
MGRGGSSKRMWEKRDKGGGGKSESRNRQPATQKKRAITGDLTSGAGPASFTRFVRRLDSGASQIIASTITERYTPRTSDNRSPAPIHERPVDFYSPISKTVSRILGLPSHTSRIVVVEYGTRRGTSLGSKVLNEVHSTVTAVEYECRRRALHSSRSVAVE